MSVPSLVSPLARYRILSPTCAVRVSPLALGAMSLGQAWSEGLGSMDKKTAFELLDAYYGKGGNFIDTANGYQDGESEIWLGEWMSSRSNRDEIVLATKYTSGHMNGNVPGKETEEDKKRMIKINYSGNSYKSMFLSVEKSLERLQTKYIDILYVHWWDYTASIPEVMQGLNNLVRSGKVLYLGISDTPAWITSKANQYARDHNLHPFVLYQGKYSAATRDAEREIIPMLRSEGMGFAPWGAIGGGKFQRAKDVEAKKKEDGRSSKGQTEEERKISNKLEEIADELKVKSVTAVALAYVLAKYPYCFPIVGGRKVEHLEQNIAALDIKLTEDHIRAIESVLPFRLGEPQETFGISPHQTGHIAELMKKNGQIDFVMDPRPIGQ